MNNFFNEINLKSEFPVLEKHTFFKNVIIPRFSKIVFIFLIVHLQKLPGTTMVWVLKESTLQAITI